MKSPYVTRKTSLFLCLIVLFIALTGCSERSSKLEVAPYVPGDYDFTVDTDLMTDSHLEPGLTTTVDSNPIENAIPGLEFSHDSGVFPEDTLVVNITAPEGYTIAFRTDGTFPAAEDDSGNSVVEVELSKNTARYLAEHKKLQIMKDFTESKLRDDSDLPSGVMLCAALVDSDGTIGEPEIKVYYLGLDFDELYPGFLVLSVATDPANLLDYDKGILATGAIYDAWRVTKEGQDLIAKQNWFKAESNSTQHGRDWERPCIVQIYDGEKTPAVEQAAGIRTQGNLARRANQKSFNLYFRSDYGEKRLNYELFPGIREYKSFSLRSGGNNYNRLKYKNAMLQELVSNRAVTVESSRPAVLFLNGEYWGPYLICEKVSAQMIRDHYDVDADKVIVIKEGEVEVGEDTDLLLYEELMSFAGQDLTKPEVYEKFCSVVNIKSFADYCAIQVYIGDNDWNPHKNDILWRTRDVSYQEGRWQFFLHDIEFSSGTYSFSSTSYRRDHYHSALEQYPLFAAAVRNDQFYSLFLSSLMEIGMENYSYDNVEAAVHRYDLVWRPLMNDYYKRFGNTSRLYDSETEATLNFFMQRYKYIVPIVQNAKGK